MGGGERGYVYVRVALGIWMLPHFVTLAQNTGVASTGDSTVTLEVSLNTQFAKVDHLHCHRMMQHLQKRCLLPPTDGGGVTGAK